MTKTQFSNEKDYLAARDIAVSLRNKKLLTDSEFVQIDTILKGRFSPVFGALFAENPCYVQKGTA